MHVYNFIVSKSIFLTVDFHLSDCLDNGMIYLIHTVSCTAAYNMTGLQSKSHSV
jgi:hypothetical protein